MKTFEEWIKEQETKKVEITAYELLTAAAKVCAKDECIRRLIKSDPSLMLTLTLFAERLYEVVFDKGENDEKDLDCNGI